jgi:DNA-binding response OmpR family regulator
MRLLLVEDDARLNATVRRGLQRAGFTVDAVELAGDARLATATTVYDAIVLDLGLPDEDGRTVLAEWRRSGNTTPVLILTARDGADDYLLKPFAMAELVARLKALLRRPSGALGTRLEVGNVCFDTVSREVEINAHAVTLARRELTLLEHLLRRAGRVVDREVLEDRIYGFGEDLKSNSLEVTVHRLRRKLAEGGATAGIHTVRGVGYFLTEETATAR